MSNTYDDPRFGVEQSWTVDNMGAINGTVAATLLRKVYVKKAAVLNSVAIQAVVGGTEASIRKIIVGRSLAGTGTIAPLGTQALGTLANGDIVTSAITGTFAAGDYLTIQHLGTGAGVYQPAMQLFMQEQFVNT